MNYLQNPYTGWMIDFIKNPGVRFCVKTGVTVFLLYVIFSGVDWQAFRATIARTDIFLFAVSFLIMAGRNVFAAIRWKLLLASDGLVFPVFTLLRFYFIGYFFNFFLPTVIGGDIARGYYLYTRCRKKKETIGTILVERLLGITVMAVLAIIATIVGFQVLQDPMVRLVVLIPSFFVVFLFIFFCIINARLLYKLPEWMQNRISRIIRMVEHLRGYKYPRVMIPAFAYTALLQGTGIVAVYLIGVSVHSHTGFYYYLVFLPVIWIITMIPVSINGLGLREGAFVFLFCSAGMERETAVFISVLYLFQVLLIGVTGSVFFLTDYKKIDLIRGYGSVN